MVVVSVVVVHLLILAQRFVDCAWCSIREIAVSLKTVNREFQSNFASVCCSIRPITFDSTAADQSRVRGASPPSFSLFPCPTRRLLLLLLPVGRFTSYSKKNSVFLLNKEAYLHIWTILYFDDSEINGHMPSYSARVFVHSRGWCQAIRTM
jgi:hypothetical protein